jgi:hypothetical protein
MKEAAYVNHPGEQFLFFAKNINEQCNSTQQAGRRLNGSAVPG